MRYLRYLLIAMLALAILLGAVAAYIAATFDPNSYKPQIIELVKEKQQRTLRLDGDIKLTFWPSLGADLGRLSLSEFKSDQEFAAVESARVSLAVMPLLSKQLVVNEVTIRGLRASLVRFKDGSLNIDDLLARDEQKQEQFKFDIDHVSIQNAAVSFRDEAKGAQYALSKVNLKTGRIANGVPTTMQLSLAAQGNQPRHNLTAELRTGLTFDLDQQVYALKDAGLDVKGQVADISNLAAKITGSATARLKSSEFSAAGLAVALSGASGKDGIDVKLDAPGLNFTAGKASIDKLTVIAKITGPQGSTGVSLMLPGIEGTLPALQSKAMTLDLDLARGALTVKGRLTSPVSGNIQAQQVSLPGLVASISASGPDVPGKKLSAELAGSVSVDAAGKNVRTNLAGKVADSTIKARLGVAGFSAPAISFDIDIDQLDVDRYMAKADGGKAAGGHKQPEQPFDLSALKNLRASGTLHIGALTASGVKASNVRLEVKANGGKLDISPVSAQLYQGTLNGTVAVNAAAMPHFAVRQKLNGISIGEDSLDYRVKTAIVGTLKGQGGQGLGELRGLTVPVHLSGPLASPSYKLDLGGMVADTAKREVEQVADKVENRLQDSLRSLFR